jgi:hypothetical protein
MEEEENNINYDTKALSIFQLNNADIESPYYSVYISNVLFFQLIVSYVGCGISFCQCIQIVSKTKETLGIGNIGCINVGKVIQHVQYMCAINFNEFNILLTDYVWAFQLLLLVGIKAINPILMLLFAFAWIVKYTIYISLPFQFMSITLD